MKYQPRNDFVVIKTTSILVNDSGIALPESSQTATVHHVVAAGPEVTDLKPGDEVLLGFNPEKDLVFGIPRAEKLSLVQQKFITCKVSKT